MGEYRKKLLTTIWYITIIYALDSWRKYLSKVKDKMKVLAYDKAISHIKLRASDTKSK